MSDHSDLRSDHCSDHSEPRRSILVARSAPHQRLSRFSRLPRAKNVVTDAPKLEPAGGPTGAGFTAHTLDIPGATRTAFHALPHLSQVDKPPWTPASEGHLLEGPHIQLAIGLVATAGIVLRLLFPIETEATAPGPNPLESVAAESQAGFAITTAGWEPESGISTRNPAHSEGNQDITYTIHAAATN